MADPLLPTVRYTGILGCVLNFNHRIDPHRGIPGAQYLVAHSHTGRKHGLELLLHLRGRHIAVSTPRESINQGEVALFYSVQAYGQWITHIHRNIVHAVFCRATVCSGVDPKQREVTGMARPYPVVGVGPVLAHGAWWRTHKPHVGVAPGAGENEAVSGKNGIDAVNPRGVGLGLGCSDRLHGLRGLLALGDERLNREGDVFGAKDEIHKKSGVGLLVGVGRGPKSMLEQVVFDARMRLNGVVPAMVVGEHQALR